jgi:hypothetical protein
MYDFPCSSTPPRRKFPSCAEREELVISVPSLCHSTREFSIIASPGAGMASAFWVCAPKDHRPHAYGWFAPAILIVAHPRAHSAAARVHEIDVQNLIRVLSS